MVDKDLVVGDMNSITEEIIKISFIHAIYIEQISYTSCCNTIIPIYENRESKGHSKTVFDALHVL